MLNFERDQLSETILRRLSLNPSSESYEVLYQDKSAISQKLKSNCHHCVKIFNIRPFRYTGMVALGEPLGYVLPLQEHFAGITSHLKLQMCDGTDPSPFI
uniref:Uncharacterized protein n=1 Tax=Hippocampus comes TaxID=109280 RepID=A0A3Q2Y8Y5_HIPCM